MRFLNSVLCVISITLTSCTSFPYRISNSPYPFPSAGPNQTKVLTVFDDTQFSKGQLISLQTLQGLVSRENPQLFRYNEPRQAFFLNGLIQQFHVGIDRSLQANYSGLLLKFFSDHVGGSGSGNNDDSSSSSGGGGGGFVRFDVTTDSVNVAISLCGANVNWIAVEMNDVALVSKLGFSQVADATTMTIDDVLAKYPLGSVFSNRIASLQDPQKGEFLSDWSVFAKGATWFDSSSDFSAHASKVILAGLKPDSAVFGWGVSEGATVDELAACQSFIHASDWAPNLAVYSAFHVPSLVQLRPPRFRKRGAKKMATSSTTTTTTSSSSTTTTSSSSSSSSSPPKHTVSFLMTDGDNIQWLLNDFIAPAWFGSPDRGKFPLGWTVSPAMAELAPSVLNQYYGLSNITDNWVAGPSGIGYTIPEKFPQGFESFCNLTSDMMFKSNLRVVNLIQDQPNLGPSTLLLGEDHIDGVVLYYGERYVGGQGLLSWSSNNKPIVTGRAAMWEDSYNPVSLARVLRMLPKDSRNPQSYSLVPVHVWSHNVSDVLQLTKLLGADGFDVVTPEALVARLQANIFHDCAHSLFASGSYKQSCANCNDACGVLSGCQCAAGTTAPATIDFFDHTQCPNQAVANCFGRLICEGDPCVCPKPPTGSYSTTCSGCVVACGLLTQCNCGSLSPLKDVLPPRDAALVSALPNFDYSVCDGLSVANCFGSLVCSGQPCQ